MRLDVVPVTIRLEGVGNKEVSCKPLRQKARCYRCRWKSVQRSAIFAKPGSIRTFGIRWRAAKKSKLEKPERYRSLENRLCCFEQRQVKCSRSRTAALTARCHCTWGWW